MIDNSIHSSTYISLSNNDGFHSESRNLIIYFSCYTLLFHYLFDCSSIKSCSLSTHAVPFHLNPFQPGPRVHTEPKFFFRFLVSIPYRDSESVFLQTKNCLAAEKQHAAIWQHPTARGQKFSRCKFFFYLLKSCIS